MLMLRVIHLWRPQKVTNFVNPHPQKWTIDLLFKNNRIRRHVTNFKTPSVWTSWRYVLLFWSPCFAKTPCCSCIVKTSKCVLESRVIMTKGKICKSSNYLFVCQLPIIHFEKYKALSLLLEVSQYLAIFVQISLLILNELINFYFPCSF